MEVGKKADNSEYGLQEDNILEIYAKLDPATNILTLHVLASGGKNTDSDNTRPDVWLNEAAKETWLDRITRIMWPTPQGSR